MLEHVYGKRHPDPDTDIITLKSKYHHSILHHSTNLAAPHIEQCFHFGHHDKIGCIPYRQKLLVDCRLHSSLYHPYIVASGAAFESTGQHSPPCFVKDHVVLDNVG